MLCHFDPRNRHGVGIYGSLHSGVVAIFNGKISRFVLGRLRISGIIFIFLLTGVAVAVGRREPEVGGASVDLDIE